MKGHIRQRSPGRFAIVVEMRNAAGKRKRKWHKFKGTKRQAQDECARLITELHGGTYFEPSKTTLAEYLVRWCGHMKSQVAPRSHERYVEIATKNIAPALGSWTLTKLQPAQISAAYTAALESGRRDGKGGLSPRTVHHIHRILKQALGQAVRWNLLVRNPCDAVDPPKVERLVMVTYDTDEAVDALETLRPTHMFVPTVLGMLCGLRRGEIAALRWHSVDLDRGQLAVVASTEQLAGKGNCREKETKGKCNRTLALSAQVVVELRAHKLRQAAQMMRMGARLQRDTHVVAKEDGSPIQPRSLTHEWVRLLGRHSLKRIKLHNTRHSHASHLLATNVHPKIVQERLGHSSIAITMDIYSHVMPNMQQEAVALVDEALLSALRRRKKKNG